MKAMCESCATSLQRRYAMRVTSEDNRQAIKCGVLAKQVCLGPVVRYLNSDLILRHGLVGRNVRIAGFAVCSSVAFLRKAA